MEIDPPNTIAVANVIDNEMEQPMDQNETTWTHPQMWSTAAESRTGLATCQWKEDLLMMLAYLNLFMTQSRSNHQSDLKSRSQSQSKHLFIKFGFLASICGLVVNAKNWCLKGRGLKPSLWRPFFNCLWFDKFIKISCKIHF